MQFNADVLKRGKSTTGCAISRMMKAIYYDFPSHPAIVDPKAFILLFLLGDNNFRANVSWKNMSMSYLIL